MPIYEYQCTDCGHRLETIQRFSDAPLTDCPSCSKSALKKLLSAPAFRLKGSGWYETDFKSGDKRNIAGSGDSDSGASDKSGGEKSGGDKSGGDKSVGEKASGDKSTGDKGASDGGGASGGASKKEIATSVSSGNSDNGGSAAKAAPKSAATD